MPKTIIQSAATAFCMAGLLTLTACGKNEAPKIDQGDGIANYSDKAVVSQSAMAAAIAPLFDDKAMAETRAVVIMQGGKIVAERYAPGYTPDTRLISWSMAKTISATLLGLMIADGRLALDEPAPVPLWQTPGDPRGKITLRNLLQMSSGLDHNEGPDEKVGIEIQDADTPRMLFLDGHDNVAQYAESKPLEAAVGEKFEYSTATTHIIDDVMTRALTNNPDPAVRRDNMRDFIKGRLFDPLGMTSAFAEFDRSGTLLGGSMIHATPRDWAKFGEFLRNNGSVRGAQLLPTSWINFMRTPSANDSAYGAHLWLNRKRPEGRDPVLFPGKGPSDIYAALGHLGQFVIVSPSQRLTIVRMGNTQEANMGPVNEQLAKIVALFPKG